MEFCIIYQRYAQFIHCRIGGSSFRQRAGKTDCFYQEKGEKEMKWLLAAGLVGYILHIYMRYKQAGTAYDELWYYSPAMKEMNLDSWQNENGVSPLMASWSVFFVGLSFLASLGIFLITREKSPVLSLLFLLAALFFLLFRCAEEIVRLCAKVVYYFTGEDEDEALLNYDTVQLWGAFKWLFWGIFRALASIFYVLLILRHALPVPWPVLFVNPLLFTLVLSRTSIRDGGDIGVGLAILLLLVLL